MLLKHESSTLILEAIVTTRNEDGSTNLSPMGPIVDGSLTSLTLKPFQTSHTYQNLKSHPCGVLHVTDDVMLIARGAIGKLNDHLPELIHVKSVDVMAIKEACRWYAFRVNSMDDSQERATIDCEVVESTRVRDFWGFNRAKHAVLEAAILATRIGILPDDAVLGPMQSLSIIVDKTGGEQELAAFELLQEYIREEIRNSAE